MDYVLLIAVDPEFLRRPVAGRAAGDLRRVLRLHRGTARQGRLRRGQPAPGCRHSNHGAGPRWGALDDRRALAEAKEVLVGYYVIKADSLDEALDWAAKIPDARFGSIEVRPVMELPDM